MAFPIAQVYQSCFFLPRAMDLKQIGRRDWSWIDSFRSNSGWVDKEVIFSPGGGPWVHTDRVTTTCRPPFSLQNLLIFGYMMLYFKVGSMISHHDEEDELFQTIQTIRSPLQVMAQNKKRYHLHIDGRIFVGFRLPGAEFSCFPRTSLETSSRWLKIWFLQILHSWCFVHVWTLFIFVWVFWFR